jgi:hypothetical protein
MAATAFDWIEALDRSFSKASEPLIAYNMEKRRREEENRKSIFEMEMMKKRLEIENAGYAARQETANKAALAQLEKEQELRTKADKERARIAMVEKANEYGANLPEDASYQDASKAFVERHGKSYVEGMRRYGSALQESLQQSGMSTQEFQNRIGNLVADDGVVANTLTPAERELIRKDIKNIDVLRAKYAISDKKKYNALTQANTQAREMLATQIEKEASGRPAAIIAANRLKQAGSYLDSIQKAGGISPEFAAEADRAYSEAAFPMQPAPEAPPVLPPPPPRRQAEAVPGVPAPGYPGQPNPMRDWYYGLNQAPPSAFSSALTPPSSVNAPTMGVPSMTVTPRPPIPFTPPSGATGADTGATAMYPGTQTQIDPSVLAALRLRSAMQGAATNQTGLYPNAFPLLSAPSR